MNLDALEELKAEMPVLTGFRKSYHPVGETPPPLLDKEGS
jgi:hypothetical protein